MKTRQILVWALMAGCLCGEVVGQKRPQPPQRPPTPAEKAARVYTSAMSQYRAKEWKQAEELLVKFTKTYPSHEYVPVAHLQLAYCREQLNDFTNFQQPLDQVIQKFAGSAAWFRAYGSRLKRAKTLKDHDGYLTLLEAMLRRTKEAPLRLSSGIGTHYHNYYWYNYRHRPFEPAAARMGLIVGEGGWIMDVVQIADTPARAERVLRALAVTLRNRKKELPTDWQFAHVALLKKAGKTAEAQKAFQDYIREWGDDPRALGLWLLKIKDAEARKDEETLKTVYKHLIKTYSGAGSKNFFYYVGVSHHMKISGGLLGGAVYRRLECLYKDDMYEEFTELARHYLKTYASGWSSRIIDRWVEMAKRKAGSGDTSRIPSTLEMLDGLRTEKCPDRQWSNLRRKIELYVILKKYEEAAKLAAELVGEKHWSAGSYSWVSRYTGTDKAFAKVIEAARAKWKITTAKPAEKASVLLKDLRDRLGDDQVRHAEEIGEEMFSKYRADAATIEAVKLLADYYFKKVLPEPRDKWMGRMVQTWPHHPLTEAVLRNQIVAERAARRYRRLAAAIDALWARFPGGGLSWDHYRARLSCYDAAKDSTGKVAFVRKHYGGRAAAGEISALDELARHELAKYNYDDDNKEIGDYWLAWAEKLTGRNTQLYCLARAWDACFGNPCYHRGGREKIRRSGAEKAIKMMQTQKMDPELQWEMAFSQANLLAHCGDGAAALKAVNEQLNKAKTYRDLSLRLDLPALGRVLGESGKKRGGLTLAGKLKKMCYTRRDAAAIELMLAEMYRIRKDYRTAARHYLRIVDMHPVPARMYKFLDQALRMLGSAKSPRYAAEIERYMRKIPRVQELVPGLMARVGGYYLSKGNPAATRVYRNLVKHYPASAGRDQLGKAIEKRRR